MNETGKKDTGRSNELPLTMSSAMGSVNRYHEYLWSYVRPALGRRVMEVGVGFGQYTRRMLAEQRGVLGCDLDAGHLADLKNSTSSSLLATLRLDLEDPGPSREACRVFSPDTIILLNVLEHVGAHEQALDFLREIAAPGAQIVLIVPAVAALYNGLDREAGHFRRYSRASLSKSLRLAGWEAVRVQYINLPGVPGWMAAGWLSRASRSSTDLNAPSTNWLLRFYDRFFVGLSRFTDTIAGRLGGLSLVAVARKP